MSSLPGAHVLDLISRIRQGDDAAWETFIDQFASLLLQAARAIEADRDDAADAFVFICEGLRKQRGARLASYDAGRPGSFETWLRVVATNLARDARRARLGRFRPLRSVTRLPLFEQRVFQLRYVQGFDFDQTLAVLLPEFPDVTERRLAEAEAELQQSVPAADRLRLMDRRPQFVPVEESDGSGPRAELRAGGPDPEGVAAIRQVRRRLSSALAALSIEDRLLVQLHFERNVTLARLAVMFGLSSPQAAHRRLREVLDRLRKTLDEPAVRSDVPVRKPDPGTHGDRRRGLPL